MPFVPAPRRRRLTRTSILLSGFALILAGCTYAISPDITSKADKTITFHMLLTDPDTFKGKIVVFGGTIADITNTKQGTLIEIVEKTLDYWGKPERTDKTGGRFLVLHPGYLDAMTYAPGRELTVAAEIAGTRSRSLGEREYSYPLLLAKEMKLWERDRSGWNKPTWIDPLYDPDNPATKHSW